MINNKPVIGIISKHFKENKSILIDTYIRDEIKQAVFDNGGMAIGILQPKDGIFTGGDDWKDNYTAEERENLISQINMCDGIIIQGGRECDIYECIVAKYCYDNDVPVLGICAGQNMLVRALGGTTYDIPNPEKHDRLGVDYVHSITIDENSKFYNIVKTKTMKVNSRHKRCVKDCPSLDIVGVCEDGYPDVIESKDKKFYIGVRFHPESLYKIDEKHNLIFKEFIKVCRN